MNLDLATRWFSSAGVVAKQISPHQQVISVFNGKPLGVSDLKKLLPEIVKSRLERHLKTAVEAGDLTKAVHGKYQKSSNPRAYRDKGFEGLLELIAGVGDSIVFESECENADDGNEGAVLDAIGE